MKCEGDRTYADSGICPVCKMKLQKIGEPLSMKQNANEPILETSIFNLTSQWTTHNEETIELKDLRGDVLVMVMVYTSCKSACPRLMADMRNIHAAVGNENVKYVLVSIDPEIDTPERLKKVAGENQMNGEQWVFLQGTNDSVREFANVLAVKYKKITPIDFSHSNIISVFDQEGVLQYQQEGLGVSNEGVVAKIKELIF